MIDTTPRFATGSLYMAAFLIAKGQPIIEIFGSPKRRSFVFNAVFAKPLAKQFREGADIRAVDFAAALTTVRGLVHSPGANPTHDHPRNNPPQ
jgi:hypothetical protein